MMNEFWFATSSMVVVACIFLFVPFIRYRHLSSKSGLTSDWFLQRKAELEEELAAGLFDKNKFDEALTELKLTAKAELQEAQKNSVSLMSSGNKNFLITASILMALVVGGFYWQVGQYKKLQDWQATIAKVPELGQKVLQDSNQTVTAAELKEFALGLRTRLKEKPDAIGWMLLGRTLMAVNDVDGSVAAFEKAHRMEPDNNSHKVNYAQALQMKGESWDIEGSLSLLSQVLKQQPNNEMALIYFAEGNLALERYQPALEVFKLVQSNLAESDPRTSALNQRISLVEQKLGLTKPLISVTINIEQNENIDLSKFKKLFVFAKIDAMPMPIAVKKLPLSAIGTTIGLSDRDTMLPQFKLSEQNTVSIHARLSIDEQAPAMQGDWQGSVNNVDLASTELVSVVVSEEVK